LGQILKNIFNHSIVILLAIFVTTGTQANAIPVPESLKDKVITLVVPFPPGGNSDSTARLLAKRTEELSGQKIVVVNKAGAAGNIGTKFVATSNPDGLVLCNCETSSAFVNSIFGMSGSVAYGELDPISITNTNSLVLVTPHNSSYTSMENLVQNAKDKEITFGSYGPLFSLWGLQLGNSIQTKNMLVVNYKGETETLIGVSQGSIDLAFVSFRSAQIGVDNKQVRILAIGDSAKNKNHPEYPILKDFVDVNVTNYNGIFGPKNMPENVKSYFNKIFNDTYQDSSFKMTMMSRGNQVIGGDITVAREYYQSYYRQRLNLHTAFHKLLEK
jgi:tripartite-type tricarboxylate transporter receptor subunit TctC